MLADILFQESLLQRPVIVLGKETVVVFFVLHLKYIDQVAHHLVGLDIFATLRQEVVGQQFIKHGALSSVNRSFWSSCIGSSI